MSNPAYLGLEGLTVTEVWHDAWRNKTVRHVIGRHYQDVRDARRCAVRFGLKWVDETGLGVHDFGGED
jgi:hypothetical protein